MAHFSLLIAPGAGRSSQWTIPFVIFSSSSKRKLSAISVSTYPQCCQGAKLSVAELKRDNIKTCMREKIGAKSSWDLPKKGWKGANFKKRLVKKFWQGIKFLAKHFSQELAALHTLHNKSFRLPLKMSTVTPFRVQVAIGKVALETAFTVPSYI
jgi:hypothetical protein